MQEYLNVFIDKEYPTFIDKYTKTQTLERLKYVTQFCGCDYTKLYSPLFVYTRFHHSIVVAHMTWHFTHNKEETIAALLHDVGTPCFAHSIDYVFGDYINQESSEKDIIEVIKKDKELMNYLKEDEISLEQLNDLSTFPILENKSPKLCTDRLDGVLHSCYIWLHTHELKKIKEVYDDLVVLENEQGKKEIGFQHKKQAVQFAYMVKEYAIALQKNEDKYTMKFVSEIVKKAFLKKLISMEDLYTKKESEMISIFEQNFITWKIFKETNTLMRTESEPICFYASLETKKRNVIPLVKTKEGSKRITEELEKTQEIYKEINRFKDTKYAYVEKIKNII